MQEPQKTAPSGLLADRLRARMAERGQSARALSIAIGANVTYVGQLLSGKGGTPSAARLDRLADALGTTTDWLMGRVESPDQVRSEISFRDTRTDFRGAPAEKPPAPLRVIGSAYCDDLAVEGEAGAPLAIERIMLETDHVVRLIERPPALWNAPDAYAIYFHGASMEPRFYQGELGVVDPRRPPGPGDDVVVQLTDGENPEVVTVLVKQLVRIAADAIELRQFNPPQTFRLPRRQVARLHRIVGLGELLAR